jgi:hypothetical protein
VIRKLSKEDAAQELGISVRTLERRIADGLYRVERGAPNRLGKRSVLVLMPDGTPAQPEPPVATVATPSEVVPFADVVLHPEPQEAPEPEPDAQIDPATFVDSFGNGLHDPNPQFIAAFRPGDNGADAIVPAVIPIRRVGVPIHRNCAPGLPTGYGLTEAELAAYVAAHPRRQIFSRS